MIHKIAYVSIACFMLAGVVLAATDEIPETVTFEGGRKGAVEFPHVAHHDAGLECITCHHNMSAEQEIPDQACRECHTADSEVKAMKAFHNNCIPCHRDENKENDLNLPTKCNECHVS